MLQIILDRLHLPGTLFIILFYSLFIFKNSKRIIAYIDKSKWVYLAPACLLTNGLAIYVCFHSEEIGTTLVHWFGYIAGATLFIFLMKLGKVIECGKVFMFLSLTGYEIYLVHHGLCSGTFSVIHLTDYIFVNYAILWFLSCCLGWLLKQIGDKLNSLVMNKIN